MNRVHFRNGVWHVVRDWRVVDAADALETLYAKNPAWVARNLDPRLPPALVESLLNLSASPAAGPEVPASSPPMSQRPQWPRRTHLGRLPMSPNLVDFITDALAILAVEREWLARADTELSSKGSK